MHLLSETHTFTGTWCLPDSEESNSIPGTLSWSSQHASLQLQSSLTPPPNGPIYGTERYNYPAIHGITTDGKIVSLLNASSNGPSFTFGAGRLQWPERLTSSIAIVGAHVTPDTPLSELMVRLPAMPWWYGPAGMKMTRTVPEHGPISICFEIDAIPDEVIDIPSAQMRLSFVIARLQSGNLVSDLHVKTHLNLRIAPYQPQKLGVLLEKLGATTTLLSFPAGSSVAPDYMQVQVPGQKAHTDLLVSLVDGDPCPFKTSGEFFMPRASMGVGLPEVFNRWFHQFDKMKLPSRLAQSVLCSSDLWPHVEFLSLMHALEGFHRATLDGLYMTKDAYEPVKQTLIDAIPTTLSKDHRKSLASRVHYGNEVSLNRRLTELAKRLDPQVRERIFAGNGGVPRSWIDTRNFYTHWDEGSRSNVLDGIDLYYAIVRARHFLRCLYLDYVGVPQEAMVKALDNASRESQRLIQLNAMEHRAKNPDSEAGAMMRITVGEPRDRSGPDDTPNRPPRK